MASGEHVYENQIGPFTLGELTDQLEHTFRDHDGAIFDLAGEGYTVTAYALKPDGTIATYAGQVLSGGRGAAYIRPLDQVGVWHVQLWATNNNEDDPPSETDLRLFASWHFVFDVQPAIYPDA